MDELDNAWADMLAAAEERATLAGRQDVADYLRLRTSNDAIRAAGVKWLLDAFTAAAFEESRHLNVEREDGHSFAHGTSTMAGTRLTIHYGVRCLEIEAGWARVPSHGIMREAAFARANVLHFGRSRENENLKLVQGDELPEWLLPSGSKFLIDDARRHIRRLLED